MIYINGLDEETINFCTGWNQATKITRQKWLTLRRKWEWNHDKTESESETYTMTCWTNKKWNYYEMPDFHQKSDYLYHMPNMPDNFYQMPHILEIRLFIADACPCSNMGWCVLFYKNSWHCTCFWKVCIFLSGSPLLMWTNFGGISSQKQGSQVTGRENCSVPAVYSYICYYLVIEIDT